MKLPQRDIWLGKLSLTGPLHGKGKLSEFIVSNVVSLICLSWSIDMIAEMSSLSTHFGEEEEDVQGGEKCFIHNFL